jgi:sarcosine oxidase
MTTTFDAVVVGAGVFGVWTAHELQRSGQRVALVDQYGPSSARSSSGDESRIIRMGYGPDEVYTRFSMRSLTMWKALFKAHGHQLFHETGVLWMGRNHDIRFDASVETLARVGVPHELLDRAELERRYPQIELGDIVAAVLEPQSGALMARRAVAAVAQAFVAAGGTLLNEAAAPPPEKGRLDALSLRSSGRISAGTFMFACGSWLPKILPQAMASRIFPTRQEVFYLGPPPGDARFAPPLMPTWLDQGSLFYGIPDLETRGFKVASDLHGIRVDPDTQERVASQDGIALMRAFIAGRFPALASAPVVESRVCQYENSWNGDFVIDRHPASDNVYIAGGGSGHGFKHGPAVGEYAAALMLGTLAHAEPRFAWSATRTEQQRAVY